MLTDKDIKELKRRGVPSYKDIFPPNTTGLFIDKMVGLVGEANRAIGNLNSYARIIPNPDLLIWPLLLKESLASSRIEGTQASVRDVLKSEANLAVPARNMDVQEVVNYREATKLGMNLLNTLPITDRLVKNVHNRLMKGTVRGREKRIGDYRIGQNAIGIEGDFQNIRYLPPPANDVVGKMKRLFDYINDNSQSYDKLVRCAFMHYEFEAIHPLADGNGRVGRLLITLYLLKENVLKYPLIYPSAYFLHHRERYSDLLMRITTHQDWISWLDFFLEGLREQAQKSEKLIEKIDSLYQESREVVRINTQSVHSDKLVEIMFKRPIIMAPKVARILNVNHQTAISLLRKLVKLGIVDANNQKKKNIPFINTKLINLLEKA